MEPIPSFQRHTLADRLSQLVTEWSTHFHDLIQSTVFGSVPPTVARRLTLILKLYGEHSQAEAILSQLVSEALEVHKTYLHWLTLAHPAIYARAESLLEGTTLALGDDILYFYAALAQSRDLQKAYVEAYNAIRQYLYFYFPEVVSTSRTYANILADHFRRDDNSHYS